MNRSAPAATASAVIGLVLWGLTAWVGDRREPWDAPEFWTLGYPAALLFSGALGYLFPDRPWRWVAILFGMQMVVIVLNSRGTGADFGLLPVGLLLLAVLALPGIGLAALGARLRRR